MTPMSDIRAAVSDGLSTLNGQLPAAKKLADADTTPLSAVDSLEMVTLIIAIDEGLKARQVRITGLAAEESFFSRTGRPATLGALAARVHELVVAAEGRRE